MPLSSFLQGYSSATPPHTVAKCSVICFPVMSRLSFPDHVPPRRLLPAHTLSVICTAFLNFLILIILFVSFHRTAFSHALLTSATSGAKILIPSATFSAVKSAASTRYAPLQQFLPERTHRQQQSHPGPFCSIERLSAAVCPASSTIPASGDIHFSAPSANLGRITEVDCQPHRQLRLRCDPSASAASTPCTCSRSNPARPMSSINASPARPSRLLFLYLYLIFQIVCLAFCTVTNVCFSRTARTLRNPHRSH